MPTQDRVGCEQRADFLESLAAEDLPFDCQSTPLVVIQQNPLLAVRLLDYLILGSQIVDHLLLLPVHPAGKDDKVELPGLKREIHERSVVVNCVEMTFTIG